MSKNIVKQDKGVNQKQFLDLYKKQKKKHIGKVCSQMKIHRATFSKWLERDKHFKGEMDTIKESMIDDVEKSLYENATENFNFNAQKYILDNRRSGQWSGEGDGVQITINMLGIYGGKKE